MVVFWNKLNVLHAKFVALQIIVHPLNLPSYARWGSKQCVKNTRVCSQIILWSYSLVLFKISFSTGHYGRLVNTTVMWYDVSLKWLYDIYITTMVRTLNVTIIKLLHELFISSWFSTSYAHNCLHVVAMCVLNVERLMGHYLIYKYPCSLRA